MDQTQHAINEVLNPYWHNKNITNIKWTSDPFPISKRFEIDLFNDLPLTEEQNKILSNEHNGSLAHWVGGLMNIKLGVHIDLCYAIMRLSTYMAHPTKFPYTALHHLLCYIFHHPHLALMYPCKHLSKQPLRCYFKRGTTEYKHAPSPTDIVHYVISHESDLAHNL